MLAPEAQWALIGWEPVNSRIITVKFITKKKDIRLNIIQWRRSQGHDFNAKIGSDNTCYEDTMGTHGLGQMNENGERFADLCALNQLVIGGSIFPNKRIHKPHGDRRTISLHPFQCYVFH
nr:hypothetical protein BaRGS_026399 [Batillaria attramentaria]